MSKIVYEWIDGGLAFVPRYGVQVGLRFRFMRDFSLAKLHLTLRLPLRILIFDKINFQELFKGVKP